MPNQRPQLPLSSRLCFAGALTVVILGSLVSFGEVGYATSGLARTVDAATRLVTLRGQPGPKVVWDSPARDQYGPKRTKICHKGRTIIVDGSAYAHVLHGDLLGGCRSHASGLGAGRNQGSGNGRTPDAPSATARSGTLASTGFALGTTAALGMALAAFGLVLRRKGRRQVRSDL